MSVFRPGNIVIDEQSTSGDARHPTTPPDWPDEDLWKRRMDHWLGLIVRRSGVATLVFAELERSPGSGSRPAVYLNRGSNMADVYTDGPFPPGTATNPTTTEAIFVTYSPPDSYGRPLDTDPMRYPPPVLLHELTHALTAIHGLNAPNSWTSSAYPTRGEFWATTMQNMMLSEQGAVLSDGYNFDDPTIGSLPLDPLSPGPMGLRADRSRSTTDIARFVTSYLDPLVAFQRAFRDLTGALAGLGMPFNPFRELRRRQSQPGGVPAPSPLGGARPPGPTGGGSVPGTLGGARTPGPIGLE